MIPRCIGCGDVIDKKKCARFEGEHICGMCWERIPGLIRRNFAFNIRTWRYLEKAADRGEVVMWSPTATYLTLYWAKMRDALEVTPFPAGLRKHLNEMGWKT